MRFTARRSVPALLLSLCFLLLAALLAAPGASSSGRSAALAQPPAQPTDEAPAQPEGGSPASSACPNRVIPPAPLDTSEELPPGSPSPQPLPVPEPALGGTRMSECGLVYPDGADTPPGSVTAASWVLADVDTGAVLAAKDPHARERPASLIKVLLAIVVIRDLRMDTVVLGTQEDADQEGTRVGIGPGGKYTVRQLLYALVMRSGNDAAHSLAGALGGVPVALDKMNALARELGALDTRAATPSGLDGPGMSTSAYDLSLIFRAAMRHEEFREGVTTRRIDFPGHSGKPGFVVTNDNRLLGSYPGFIGGKTGFTDDARHTYLGAAEQDGRRISVVMLRGERNDSSLAEQGAKLLDYGFELAEDEHKAVGELVERSPEAQPKQDPGAPDGDQEQAGADAAAPTGDDPMRSAFGNAGLPLVALAGVVVLISLGLWWRRRKARLARQSA